MNDPDPSQSLLKLEIIFSDPKWRKNPLISKAFFQELIQTTLNQLGLIKCPIEVSLLLTNDEKIQALNHKYRGHNKPTNVLSFPSLERGEIALVLSNTRKEPLLLGDIVLAYETIAGEVKINHKPFDHHCAHLVVHGLLHLLGYDHEKETEAEVMESLEINILATLGIPSPY